MPEIFRRPRITALMEQGIKNNLVSVVAMPGYGKTYEASSFFEYAQVRDIWLRVKRLDNWPTHFWDNMLETMAGKLPFGARQLAEIGFPDTLAKMDAVLRVLAREIYQGTMVAFVVDDYHIIENIEIKNFFNHLIDANFENFSLVLMGRKLTDVGLQALKSESNTFTISTEDLKFTLDETEAFFKQRGLGFSKSTVRAIHKDCGGWPLMTHLLARQLHLNPGTYMQSRGASMEIVNLMFEKDFFSQYDDIIRQLLVNLSFPTGFSAEVVQAIGGCEVKEAMEMLKDNMFVTYDHGLAEYSSQNMYKEFLSGKQVFVPDEERKRIYSVVGDYEMQRDIYFVQLSITA